MKKSNKYGFVLDKNKLDTINSINSTVYNGLLLENVNKFFNCKEEFLNKCRCIDESQLELIYHDTWYMLLAHHYNHIQVLEWASLNGSSKDSINFMYELYKHLIKYRNKRFFAYSRDSSSYILMKMLERKKMINVIRSEPVTLSGELFHELVFKLIPRNVR